MSATSELRKGCWMLLALGIYVAPSAGANAESTEAFYKNNPLRMVVGSTPGAGYDVYARTVARHIGKHIPGKPNVIVQNMPGAGSMKAINYLANIAPKDGSTIAAFTRGIPMEPLFKNPDARFDPLKLNWIGSPSQEASVVFAWHKTPFKNFNDVLNNEMVVAATGSGADSVILPILLNDVFKSKMKVVTGYAGGAETLLAAERGEADGVVVSWSSIKVPKPDWIADKKISLLLQLALERHADLPDVPLAIDLVENDEDRQLLELFISRLVMAWPIAAPQDVPAERVNALRQAFDAAMKDPELFAEAKKQNMDIAPVSGIAIAELMTQIYGSPEDLVERARAIVKAGR